MVGCEREIQKSQFPLLMGKSPSKIVMQFFFFLIFLIAVAQSPQERSRGVQQQSSRRDRRLAAWSMAPDSATPPSPAACAQAQNVPRDERQYFRAKGSGLTLLGRLEERGLRPEAVHAGTCSAQSSAVLICVYLRKICFCP